MASAPEIVRCQVCRNTATTGQRKAVVSTLKLLSKHSSEDNKDDR
jgi:hypothetical protein